MQSALVAGATGFDFRAAKDEAETVRRAYESVTAVMSGLSARYAYEILFTDNHSTDGTDAILREIAAADPRVRVVRFSKNFGLQRSIFAGYALYAGDAAVQLDCLLLGVIGEYLERLYEQSKGRPLVVIESSINLPSAPSSLRPGESP